MLFASINICQVWLGPSSILSHDSRAAKSLKLVSDAKRFNNKFCFCLRLWFMWEKRRKQGKYIYFKFTSAHLLQLVVWRFRNKHTNRSWKVLREKSIMLCFTWSFSWMQFVASIKRTVVISRNIRESIFALPSHPTVEKRAAENARVIYWNFPKTSWIILRDIWHTLRAKLIMWSSSDNIIVQCCSRMFVWWLKGVNSSRISKPWGRASCE